MLCGIRLEQHDESYLRWGGATMPAPCESQREARGTARLHERAPTFHELLQKETDATLLHDPLSLLDDANAKVGTHKTCWEGTMGNEGLSIALHVSGVRNKRISLEFHFCENFSDIFQ